MKGVYIHIPFCEKKCNYCAFASFVQNDEIENYISHLKKEIQDFKDKNNKSEIDSLYFGGGTPSILSTKQFEEIFLSIRDNFAMAKDCEITVECNPNSLTKEKLDCYKKLGVNRLSIGVQSLDDQKLKNIGRLHTKEEAIAKITLAKEIGFENISVDLLLGLEGCNEEEFLSEIQTLISLGVKHFSCYMLQVEKGTPLEKMVIEKKMILPDDDETVQIYANSAEFLQQNGYLRYEISNFAQNGYESKHNFKYWTGEEYVGFGLGAHSYLQGKRIANSSTFKGYYAGEKTVEILTEQEKIEEHIMLGLRCKNGIDLKYLKALNVNLEANEYFAQYIAQGILTRVGDKVYLNPDYYGVNNYIIVHLLPQN